MVIPRDEMTVRSITGSSEHEPNNVSNILTTETFQGIKEDAPLMTAYSRKHLNIIFSILMMRLKTMKSNTAIFGHKDQGMTFKRTLIIVL